MTLGLVNSRSSGDVQKPQLDFAGTLSRLRGLHSCICTIRHRPFSASLSDDCQCRRSGAMLFKRQPTCRNKTIRLLTMPSRLCLLPSALGYWYFYRHMNFIGFASARCQRRRGREWERGREGECPIHTRFSSHIYIYRLSVFSSSESI